VIAEQRLDRTESGDFVDDLLDDLFALDLAERRWLGAQELDDGVADLLDENCLVLDRLERLEVEPLDEPAVKVDLELLDGLSAAVSSLCVNVLLPRDASDWREWPGAVGRTSVMGASGPVAAPDGFVSGGCAPFPFPSAGLAAPERPMRRSRRLAIYFFPLPKRRLKRDP
jgi:hypothetical protein